MATEKREEEKEEVISKNFIEQEIEKDLAEGVYKNIMSQKRHFVKAEKPKKHSIPLKAVCCAMFFTYDKSST